MCMPTLDITNIRGDLVIVSGFGLKHWETAVYLKGALFASGRDGFEDADHPATKLSKHLAAEAGYSWVERETHIWWRQGSWSDIPESLSEYDALTLEAYRATSEQGYLESIRGAYIPRNVEEERHNVAGAFAFSGGDEDQFETWYSAWLENHRSFNDRYRSEVDKRIILDARRKESDSVEVTLASAEQYKVLQDLLTGYLLEAYRADKPLDTVAIRAQATEPCVAHMHK